MLLILSDAAFSHTKCAAPTIALAGTICILLVCLTTRMNPSTQPAQLRGYLYYVGITTAYSWAWGRNIHHWVLLHLLEKVDINVLAGRRSSNWRFWFGGVQLKDNTGVQGTWPWKVLSRSLSIYCTQMLCDPGMIPWLASVYSTLLSGPRRSTDVGQWIRGWLYNSPFWRLINILYLSAFWSYPSTSPQTLCHHLSLLCARNGCPKSGIRKSSDASLSEVNLILLHTLWTGVSLKWCTCCDMRQKNGSSGQCWRGRRYGLRGFSCVSVADSRLKTLAESISYQPWMARWDSVSSIYSRLVHRPFCLSICQI